jgi:hypothetical protein
MELSTLKEYIYIRDEMQNLKNCITNYVGFVLGGSGIAFIGFQFTKADDRLTEISAFVSIVLAIILSLVLSIILYKFNSHNRYAGYCKLLNQERIILEDTDATVDAQTEYNIFSWEICINRLRNSDFEQNPFHNLYAHFNIDDIITDNEKATITNFSGKTKSVDKWKFFKGIKLLFQTLLGKVNTRSWQFPLFVVSVFFALAIIYLGVSLFLYSQVSVYEFNFSNICYTILLLLLLRMWFSYIGKLYTLMEGSSTVDAFCWKFYPIRYAFLKVKFPSVQYSVITLS